MAKYRVLQKSFIGNSIVEEGTVVEYEGIPHSSNLEPIDDSAEKAKHAAKGEDVIALKRQAFAAKGGDPADVDAFERFLAENTPGAGLV